jgi:hypothetical protein
VDEIELLRSAAFDNSIRVKSSEPLVAETTTRQRPSGEVWMPDVVMNMG